MAKPRFLPELVAAVERCSSSGQPSTLHFTSAVDTVLPVFDSLGAPTTAGAAEPPAARAPR